MVAVWWAASTQLPPVLLPAPDDVVIRSWEARAKLAEATWTTTWASLVGLAMALGFGLSGAVAFQRSWERWASGLSYR